MQVNVIYKYRFPLHILKSASQKNNNFSLAAFKYIVYNEEKKQIIAVQWVGCAYRGSI